MPLDVARGVVIAVQAQVMGLLVAESARLAGHVADLAARAERLAWRNGGHSPMPRSADDLPGRTPAQCRRAGGGGSAARVSRRGGAPGLE
jgi:hypothetical protein